jgi:hypothetical protein
MMPVDFGDKKYQMVAERLPVFWKKYPDHVINTRVEHVSQHGLIIRAEIIDDGVVVSTGHSTAPFTPNDKQGEKCESVAVGRALAFLCEDLMGSEIASADEIEKWQSGATEKEVMQKYVRHADAFKKNWDSIVFIKQALAEDKLSAALEAYNEISEDDRIALRMAPTKGAVWTIEDTKKMKQAHEEDFNPETGVYESIARKNNE